MKKIPTLFRRDPDDLRRVLPEVNPGCEWVLAGAGFATRKYDGTCLRLDVGGRWWARREVKPGKEPPPAFIEVDHDTATGKRVGWEPIEETGWGKFLAEAADESEDALYSGTYELCGPKVNGNPEGYERRTDRRSARTLSGPLRSRAHGERSTSCSPSSTRCRRASTGCGGTTSAGRPA